MSLAKFWFFDESRPGKMYLGTEKDADRLVLDGGKLNVIPPSIVLDIRPEPGYIIKWQKKEWHCEDCQPRWRNLDWAN
jgi:hypothetical protein